MKKVSCFLYISVLLALLAGCANVGVGGSVSGGSNGNVNVGAGVNIHLYTEKINE